MAVGEGEVDRALVPIENSLEGSVNATLDALAIETEDVVIVGELVHPIRHCLIARDAIALESIGTVASIPQATAQCARFIRARLRGATVIPADSTADAVSRDVLAALVGGGLERATGVLHSRGNALVVRRAPSARERDRRDDSDQRDDAGSAEDHEHPEAAPATASVRSLVDERFWGAWTGRRGGGGVRGFFAKTRPK